MNVSRRLGGNSVKASSGINGAGTEIQKASNISDSAKALYVSPRPTAAASRHNIQLSCSYDDTAVSAGTLARPHLITALTSNSASAIEWLTGSYGVDLSLVSRLGGHSIPRTHRDKKGAPGWAITSGLLKKLTEEEAKGDKAKVLKNSKVVKILQEEGKVVGVEYETVSGERLRAEGSVVIATG